MKSKQETELALEGRFCPGLVYIRLSLLSKCLKIVLGIVDAFATDVIRVILGTDCVIDSLRV